jgi:hypothetical protein
MIWSRFLPGAAAVVALALASGPAVGEEPKPALPATVPQAVIDRPDAAQMFPWAVYKRRPAEPAWTFHGAYRLHHEAEQAARSLRREGWEVKVVPHHHLEADR